MTEGRRGRGGEKAAGRQQNGNVGGLTGGGPSTVGPSGSMRARDVSRPSAADLAEAARTLVIRRRPPDDPPGAKQR